MNFLFTQPVLIYATVLLMAAWGGIVAYILNVQRGYARPSYKRLFAQIMVSGFTGFISGLLALDKQLSLPLILGIAGLSGASGNVLLSLLKQKFLQRLQQQDIHAPPKRGR